MTVTIEDLLEGSEARLGLVKMSGLSGLMNGIRHTGVQYLAGATAGAELAPQRIVILKSWESFGETDDLWTIVQGKIISSKTPCIFLPGAHDIPPFMVSFSERSAIPIVASTYPEMLIASRLTSLLREKFDQVIFLQGVLFRMLDCGVLLTGVSGVGKTTCALKIVQKGHAWIADDMIEIERQYGRILYGRSIRKIGYLVDLKQSGVRPVSEVLGGGNLLAGAVLDLVIDLEKTSDGPHDHLAAWSRTYLDIMGINVPRFKLSVVKYQHMEKQVERIIRCYLRGKG
jgi:HPr kinase/phosphorylase